MPKRKKGGRKPSPNRDITINMWQEFFLNERERWQASEYSVRDLRLADYILCMFPRDVDVGGFYDPPANNATWLILPDMENVLCYAVEILCAAVENLGWDSTPLRAYGRLQLEVVRRGPLSETGGPASADEKRIEREGQVLLERLRAKLASGPKPVGPPAHVDPASAGPAAGNPPPPSRCAPMKKNEIAARILDRRTIKCTRPRAAAKKLDECCLKDEGNGKWSIRLDVPDTLSAEAIERLRMPEWPPPLKIK